jgi:Arc/MetJ-type ribon-helix-helix transcriptional regulator
LARDDEQAEPGTAEMVSMDTMMVDLGSGTPKLVAAAAPSLASSWLGYAQNPGFYEQEPPLSALPAFAASIGQTAEGADSRAETIRRALRLIPERAAAHRQEDPTAVRAKSFLFFYALQDNYGQDVFRKAISHMLYARRERGFALNDLIAAFEQETHQNVAEFVRLWMKRPGVPEEFRARYRDSAAAATQVEKETAP